MQGAKNISEYELAKAFLKHVKGLDDESICCAHKLVEFDVYYRAQMSSFYRSMQKEKSPVLTDETIENVRTMVLRSLHLLKIMDQLLKMVLLLRELILMLLL